MSDFASMYFGAVVPLNLSSNLEEYDSVEDFNGTTTFNPFQYDNYSNDTDSRNRDPLYLIIPITIIYTLILFAGIIGNVSTCIVIVRNRSMHTATNYYLFSLAISDLLLLLSGLPPEMYKIWYPDVYIFGEATCVFLGLSSETSANATVLTITAFTVERYIAICHPFLSHTMSKLSRVIKFIVAIWILALCLAIPQAIQFGVVYELMTSSCTVKWVMVEHAFEISGFVFFVGPMTVITVLYVLIGVKLRTSRLLQSTKKSSFNSNPEHPNGSARSYKNGVSQSRAIKMLVAVTVSFFLCWAPFHAQRLLAMYGKNMEEPSQLLMQVYEVLTYLSGVLYFLSTTINPFLYNIMSNKFREAFKTTIAQRCCRTNRRSGRGKNTRGNGRPHNVQGSGMHRSNTRMTTVHNSVKKPHNNNHQIHVDKRHPQQQQALLDKSISAMVDNENQTVKLELKPINKKQNSKSNSSSFASLTDKLKRTSFCTFTLKSKSTDTSTSYDSHFECNNGNLKEVTDSGSQSISNSSLQDLDEEEFTGRELAMFMGQVNHNIV